MADRERKTVVFSGPRTVEVRREAMQSPASGEVLVQTMLSGISPGTERLVYRGDASPDVAADDSLSALEGDLQFPLQYGYCAVGRVRAVGSNVDPSWEGRRVFAFQPHASAFVAPPDELVVLPDAISDEQAIFIPNLETAVNLLMDGRPVIGERVVVFGQGIVGLLTTGLLSRYPIDVYTVELHQNRRALSDRFGADATFASAEEEGLQERLSPSWSDHGTADGATGADLVYELTGDPSVLSRALRVTGFDSRIVVGSWYGTRTSPVDWRGHFHRSRIDITSSQVSTVAPELRGRWTKRRRMNTVLDVLPTLPGETLISHRFSIDDAAEAYAELDANPASLIQPVLVYGDGR